MPGTLYVVATPIGNLEDITLRALRVLREVDLICAEDTRVTRKLLSHYDIHTPLTACFQHTRKERLDELAQRLAQGACMALVSDAGTPGISDPGAELVAHALRVGAHVVPIPGPSAPAAALSVLGVPATPFVFEGFAPRTTGDRREFMKRIACETRTVVLFEAGNRLAVTLKELLHVLGDRDVFVFREITKRFEEHYRGSLSSAMQWAEGKQRLGEVTVVIPAVPQRRELPSPEDIRRALAEDLASGVSRRDAVKRVSTRLGVPRSAVYAEQRAMSSLEQAELLHEDR